MYPYIRYESTLAGEAVVDNWLTLEPHFDQEYRLFEVGCRQYAIHWAALRSGGLNHVCVFRGLESGLDICGHQEASVTDIDNHAEDGEMVCGDLAGPLGDAHLD